MIQNSISSFSNDAKNVQLESFKPGRDCSPINSSKKNAFAVQIPSNTRKSSRKKTKDLRSKSPIAPPKSSNPKTSLNLPEQHAPNLAKNKSVPIIQRQSNKQNNASSTFLLPISSLSLPKIVHKSAKHRSKKRLNADYPVLVQPPSILQRDKKSKSVSSLPSVQQSIYQLPPLEKYTAFTESVHSTEWNGEIDQHHIQQNAQSQSIVSNDAVRLHHLDLIRPNSSNSVSFEVNNQVFRC